MLTRVVLKQLVDSDIPDLRELRERNIIMLMLIDLTSYSSHLDNVI